MSREQYISPLFNRIQRWQMFVNTHIFWKFQFFKDLVVNKMEQKNIPIENPITNQNPLVYSCSGCSSAAQMANYLAVQLDRKNVAEMSCIAGVGGNVKKLVRTATSGRKIIVIDGCPLACSKACLGNHSITPDVHIELTSMGVKKMNHVDFDMQQANKILEQLQQQLEEKLV